MLSPRAKLALGRLEQGLTLVAQRRAPAPVPAASTKEPEPDLPSGR